MEISSTESPYRFSTDKNKRNHPQRLELGRYDPVAAPPSPLQGRKAGARGTDRTEEIARSRKCDITGKRPLVGSNVSDAHNKTGKRQWPNLKTKRIWVPELRKSVRIKVSTSRFAVDQQGGVDGILCGRTGSRPAPSA